MPYLHSQDVITMRVHRRTQAISFRFNGQVITRERFAELWGKAKPGVLIMRDASHVRAVRELVA